MKCKNRIATLLLVVLMLYMFPVTAYAHEVPDRNQKGAITVEMKYDGETVTGGTLTAYRVGQVQEDNGDYSFVKTSDMDAFYGDYDDISTVKLAEDVAAFVKAHSIRTYATVENIEGKAAFTDLELGLYLIVQTKESEGYEAIKPFLVSVPMNEDGHYVYQVNAKGKFQLQQEPKPATPPTSFDPKLPQTGQLNWPIPVLVMLGLGLLSIGWILRFGKKKDGYEN